MELRTRRRALALLRMQQQQNAAPASLALARSSPAGGDPAVTSENSDESGNTLDIDPCALDVDLQFESEGLDLEEGAGEHETSARPLPHGWVKNSTATMELLQIKVLASANADLQVFRMQVVMYSIA